MKKVRLGTSDLEVSEVCLGSMTWGRQNTLDDAFVQIDFALDQGINFIDTAEMYPVPPKPELSGDTERYIGKWLKANPQKRDGLVIASKMVGAGLPWIREGRPISGADLKAALEGSLQRLNLECIDVYQLHWPNRTSPHFGKHWPGMVPHTTVDCARQEEEMLDILNSLQTCIDEGKIKHFGLSNDTPWGIGEYVRLSEKHQLPRPVSVQNEFNLIHAKDSPYMLESCVLEGLAYLPWSPLAGGVLSGKYRNGQMPEGARWSLSQRNGLFRDQSQTHEAIEHYLQIAERHHITLAQLALYWVYQTEGVVSTIIGATSLDQLKENIDAYYLKPSAELMEEVNQVFKAYPVPF
ncbi:aldo/keto reductase [uncultured Endozoicomonas sp.]|uniref:aldo/keto reductase n=1 Tax=uncultured Endozoicomonas sp. TaxID=432652 RepID=UPI002612B77A|nr:aldo/keto reductase [uncultured Endozoicomonas sp.]